MKIHVRRRHIKAGIRGRAHECPIALAFEEITGERPWVEGEVLGTNDDAFALPRVAQRFVELFDAGKPVKPFAFVLKNRKRV